MSFPGGYLKQVLFYEVFTASVQSLTHLGDVSPHFSRKPVHFVLSQTPFWISAKLYLYEVTLRGDTNSFSIFFGVIRCLNTQASVLALVNMDFLAQALVSVGLKIT